MCVIVCVCVCSCVCGKERLRFCTAYREHTLEAKVPLCACLDSALRIGNVGSMEMCQCVRRASRL